MNTIVNNGFDYVFFKHYGTWLTRKLFYETGRQDNIRIQLNVNKTMGNAILLVRLDKKQLK